MIPLPESLERQLSVIAFFWISDLQNYQGKKAQGFKPPNLRQHVVAAQGHICHLSFYLT